MKSDRLIDQWNADERASADLQSAEENLIFIKNTLVASLYHILF